MEFPFSFENILPGAINKVSGPSFEVESWDENGDLVRKFRPNVGWLRYMRDVLDTAGLASAKAQALSAAITTFEKMQNFEHSVYIVTKKPEKKNQGFLLGLLKVGQKKLFLLDNEGFQNEVSPLCVLDFYVPETVQRRGHGKTLFEFMLKHEDIQAHHLAIDRPSEKFLAFLSKYYGLNQTIPQMINFVVFHNFFENRPDEVSKNTRDRMYRESSPRNSPQAGRRNVSPAPGGVVYVQTAAKQKSSLAQILTHEHLDDSSVRRSNGPNGIDNTRSAFSSHGEPSYPAGKPALTLSSPNGAEGPLFSSSAARKDAKYSHNRLW